MLISTRKNKSLESLLHQKSGKELINFLKENLEKLEQESNGNLKIGKSIKDDIDWFKSEYLDRSEGKSFKIWPSSFPSLNRPWWWVYKWKLLYFCG